MEEGPTVCEPALHTMPWDVHWTPHPTCLTWSGHRKKGSKLPMPMPDARCRTGSGSRTRLKDSKAEEKPGPHPSPGTCLPSGVQMLWQTLAGMFGEGFGQQEGESKDIHKLKKIYIYTYNIYIYGILWHHLWNKASLHLPNSTHPPGRTPNSRLWRSTKALHLGRVVCSRYIRRLPLWWATWTSSRKSTDGVAMLLH